LILREPFGLPELSVSEKTRKKKVVIKLAEKRVEEQNETVSESVANHQRKRQVPEQRSKKENVR